MLWTEVVGDDTLGRLNTKMLYRFHLVFQDNVMLKCRIGVL